MGQKLQIVNQEQYEPITLLQKTLMTCKRAFAAQAPQHQKTTSKHGDVEGAEADEQDQLLGGRAQVAAGG